MANMLLIDSVGYTELTLQESVNGKCIFQGKFQEADCINKNKRLYPYDVLDKNVQGLQEMIDNRGLYGEIDHPCLHSSDFRVLTPNGWKQFEDIRVGDYVWSRVNGKMVKSRVNAIVNEPYDGPAFKVKGRSINSTFTPGHRFLMSARQDYNPSDKEIYATIATIHNNRSEYNHNVIPKTAKWNGNLDSEFVIPGVTRKTKGKDYSKKLVVETKNFVAFLGIYLAEGCLKKLSNRIEICQKNEVGRALLREMLPKLHKDIEWHEFDTGFYAVDGRLYDYLVPLGNKYTKYVPEEVKNLDGQYLEELIRWFAIGDGRMQVEGKSFKSQLNEHKEFDLGANSRINVFSVSKKLIDDLHECLVKTGRCGARKTFISDKDYIFAGRRVIKADNKHPLYQLHISRSKYIHLDARFLHITQVHHTGRIYCLSTEYGNFYMEQEGKSFWTGNSDSIIHLANASHLVTKLWWEGNVLMGKAEILNTPAGKILKALVESGGRVGISSRAVGNGKTNESGVLIINDDLRIITFDTVCDPSCKDAFQQKIVAKKESYEPTPKVENTVVKPSSHKSIVSYFGCLLNKRLQETKEKIRAKE